MEPRRHRYPTRAMVTCADARRRAIVSDFLDRFAASSGLIHAQAFHLALRYADDVGDVSFKALAVSLFTASKYACTSPLEIAAVCRAIRKSAQEVVQAEARLLYALDFRLERPTLLTVAGAHGIEMGGDAIEASFACATDLSYGAIDAMPEAKRLQLVRSLACSLPVTARGTRRRCCLETRT